MTKPTRTGPPRVPVGRVPRGKGSQRKNVAVQGRMAQFMAGEITMADLDTEELLKGQLRADDGTFRGRPPKLIPREMHDEMVRELLARGDQLIRESFVDAIEAFKSIAKDRSLEPRDRLKAAQYLWERVAGKLADRVDLKVAMQPWELDVKGIIANIPEPDE